MYNKIIIACFFALFSLNVEAQETITTIRDYYKKVEAQIVDCEKSENCELYKNVSVINAGDEEWRGSGNYKKEVQFWYNDIPSHCDECGEEGINVLKKVVISEQASLVTVHKEFLFKDGNLIFYYIKFSGEQNSEYRFYYSKGKLIKYLKEDQMADDVTVKDKYSKAAMQKAVGLKKQFLSEF